MSNVCPCPILTAIAMCWNTAAATAAAKYDISLIIQWLESKDKASVERNEGK